MKRPPRRHHVVPAAYLAGFTPTGRRDDFLWVYDAEGRRRWRARPDQAGIEKDFYRIRVDGIDEFALEEGLGRAESELIPHLREFLQAERMVRSSLEPVLLFFAIQVVRGTSIRRLVEQVAMNHVLRMAEFVSADEDTYASMLASLREHGHDPETMPTRNEFREALSSGGISAEFESTEIHREVFRHVEYFHGLLTARHWSVTTPAEGAGYFVTSENPLPVVGLLNPEPNVAVKFGLYERDCVLPLSHSLALVGREEPGEIPDVLGEESVAYANAHVISAARYIFSPTQDFRFRIREGEFGDQADILADRTVRE